MAISCSVRTQKLPSQATERENSSCRLGKNSWIKALKHWDNFPSQMTKPHHWRFSTLDWQTLEQQSSGTRWFFEQDCKTPRDPPSFCDLVVSFSGCLQPLVPPAPHIARLQKLHPAKSIWPDLRKGTIWRQISNSQCAREFCNTTWRHSYVPAESESEQSKS